MGCARTYKVPTLSRGPPLGITLIAALELLRGPHFDRIENYSTGNFTVDIFKTLDGHLK